MSPNDTEFYHEALDVVPREVVELARFLRELSVSRETANRVYDDPLDETSWSLRRNATISYYNSEGQVDYRNGDVLRLNWFGLGRDCPVPGMPAWKWRQIVSAMRALWDSRPLHRWEGGDEDDDSDPFAESNKPRRRWGRAERGDAVAKLLLEQCADFMRTFLVEARPIPIERAEAVLSPRQWEVVALVCNQRLDAPEAAATLGIEVSTVRKYLEEAAKALDMSVKELRRRRIAFPEDSSHNELDTS